jgi:hypothetical protein
MAGPGGGIRIARFVYAGPGSLRNSLHRAVAPRGPGGRASLLESARTAPGIASEMQFSALGTGRRRDERIEVARHFRVSLPGTIGRCRDDGRPAGGRGPVGGRRRPGRSSGIGWAPTACKHRPSTVAGSGSAPSPVDHYEINLIVVQMKATFSRLSCECVWSAGITFGRRG